MSEQQHLLCGMGITCALLLMVIVIFSILAVNRCHREQLYMSGATTLTCTSCSVKEKGIRCKNGDKIKVCNGSVWVTDLLQNEYCLALPDLVRNYKVKTSKVDMAVPLFSNNSYTLCKLFDGSPLTYITGVTVTFRDGEENFTPILFFGRPNVITVSSDDRNYWGGRAPKVFGRREIFTMVVPELIFKRKSSSSATYYLACNYINRNLLGPQVEMYVNVPAGTVITYTGIKSANLFDSALPALFTGVSSNNEKLSRARKLLQEHIIVDIDMTYILTNKYIDRKASQLLNNTMLAKTLLFSQNEYELMSKLTAYKNITFLSDDELRNKNACVKCQNV